MENIQNVNKRGLILKDHTQKIPCFENTFTFLKEKVKNTQNMSLTLDKSLVLNISQNLYWSQGL